MVHSNTESKVASSLSIIQDKEQVYSLSFSRHHIYDGGYSKMLVAGSAKQNYHDGDLTGILVLSANVINRVANPENHVTLTKFDMA